MKMPWPDVPVGEFAASIVRREEVNPEKYYRQVGVRLWGNGAYERETIKGSNTKYKSLFRISTNDIIINKIWARNGSVAVITPELDGTYGSGEFPTFSPNLNKLDPLWFRWITQWRPFWSRCEEKSRGATGKNRIKPQRFLEITIPLPPLSEQQRIVKKIEQVASRVKKAKFLSEKIEEDQTALLLRRAGEICKEARFLKMSEVAPIIRRHVDIKPDKWYPELGIRSFGRGTFHKVAIKGSDVGKKPLFHIEVGDLLISQVFAWEGAIAVVQPENKGRFGSHRFITCLPDPNLATAEFLCYYFLTDSGLKDLRKASTGAAGRNKPLGFTRLPNIKVPIPPIEIQKNFSQLVNYIKNVKQIHRQVVIGLGHVIPALLDQAFGGEL